jgi:predicted aspartyl protease
MHTRNFLMGVATLVLSASAAGADTLTQQAQRAPLGDTRAIDSWLPAHPHAPATQRAEAYGALCEIHARVGRYRAAAEACGRVVDLQGRRATATSRQSLTVWRTLADTPPIAVRGEVDVSLTYGWTGMAEAPVQAGSVSSSWGIDTGAEISTISVSDAARFGVRIIETPVEVQGSTPGTAAGRIGVIDHLRIGAARIDNVPVFILPDAALTFDGRRVPPLLGAPMLYAFGHVEFANHAQRLRLSAARPPLLPGSLSWVDGGLAIELGLPHGRLDAHLDTGANVSELNVSTRALLTALQRSRLTLSTGRLAGVSGQIQRRHWRSQPLDLNLGGGICRLDGLEFGDERAGAQGRVGIDLVKSCGNFVFDVSTMTFSARGD